jgi:hypothetical protein
VDVLQVSANIARGCIPELQNVPLYLVQMAQAAGAFPGIGANCFGTYHPQLCRALRPQLEAQGTWQGDGVAVAIDLDSLRAEYGASSYAFPRAVAGVVLHEAIHWLLRPALPLVAVADDDAGDVAAAVASSVELPSNPLAYAAAALASHGIRFTRLACHLSHRTTVCGPFHVAPSWLMFAGCYPGLEALGEPAEYMAALETELHSRCNDSLLAIAESDLPKPFIDLWAAGARRLFAATAAA